MIFSLKKDDREKRFLSAGNNSPYRTILIVHEISTQSRFVKNFVLCTFFHLYISNKLDRKGDKVIV